MQAMHPTARAGYLYLLGCEWQSDDCSLSADPMDLADMSGLGDELWTAHSARILRNFKVLDNGRLLNEVLLEEWNGAKHIFEARKASALRTNTVRSPHGHREQEERSPSRSADTITGTVTGTETEISTEAKEKEPPMATPPNTPRKRRTNKAASSPATPSISELDIPDFLDAQVWHRFVEMRQEIKKPVTPSVAKGVFSTLGRFYKQGFDPNAVMDETTAAKWQGLFPKDHHRINGGFNGNQGNRSNYGPRSKTAGNFDAAREALFALAGEESCSPGDSETGECVEGHFSAVRG